MAISNLKLSTNTDRNTSKKTLKIVSGTGTRKRISDTIASIEKNKQEVEAQLKESGLPADTRFDGMTLQDINDALETMRQRLQSLKNEPAQNE